MLSPAAEGKITFEHEERRGDERERETETKRMESKRLGDIVSPIFEDAHDVAVAS